MGNSKKREKKGPDPIELNPVPISGRILEGAAVYSYR